MSEDARISTTADAREGDAAPASVPLLPQDEKMLRLSPLTSAAAVCQHGAQPKLGALCHVVQRISEYLGYARPPYWTIARACEKNRLTLLHRIAVHGLAAGVDKYYEAFQFSKGLVFAVRHENHDIVEWLPRNELCHESDD